MEPEWGTKERVTIRDRLKEITKAVLPGTLSKGGLAESSITRINTAMGLFV